MDAPEAVIVAPVPPVQTVAVGVSTVIVGNGLAVTATEDVVEQDPPVAVTVYVVVAPTVTPVGFCDEDVKPEGVEVHA